MFEQQVHSLQKSQEVLLDANRRESSQNLMGPNGANNANQQNLPSLILERQSSSQMSNGLVDQDRILLELQNENMKLQIENRDLKEQIKELRKESKKEVQSQRTRHERELKELKLMYQDEHMKLEETVQGLEQELKAERTGSENQEELVSSMLH